MTVLSRLAMFSLAIVALSPRLAVAQFTIAGNRVTGCAPGDPVCQSQKRSRR